MKTMRLLWLALAPALTGLLTLAAASHARAQASTTNLLLPPVVTVRATDPVAQEPGVLTVIDPGIFTVYRNAGTNDDLQVFYTVAGTASNGMDYLPLSNAVVIPRGALSAQIVVSPLPDNLVEGTETVILKLQPIVCIAIYPPPPGCYTVGRLDEATVYILDANQTNQPPAVRIVKPMCGQTFPAPASIDILADTVDSDGYVGKVEFFANNQKIGEAEKYFFARPPPFQHIPYEFLWTNVPPGCYALTARATDDQGASTLSAPVGILVFPTNQPPTNLPPIVTIVAIDPVAAEGTNCWRWPGYTPCLTLANCLNCWTTNICGTNTATFLVRRTGGANADLTVHYLVGGTASNGVDYVALPGVVTIPAGKRWAPIVVVPIDDPLPEPIETVVLKLVPSPLDVFPPPYFIGRPSKAAAIIVDNDQPRPPICVLPDRCFHFRCPGTNGLWFRIECSTNFVNWLPICTNIVTDGAVHFVDPDAQDAPSRFYRAVQETNPPALE